MTRTGAFRRASTHPTEHFRPFSCKMRAFTPYVRRDDSHNPGSRERRAMNWVALKMLTGDRSKYVGIVFGITFASMLICQQASIFCGVMWRTTSQIRDIPDADVWVMNERVDYIDDVRPVSDNDLYRVRSVPGIDWAVWLYKGSASARLRGATSNT